MGARLAKGAVLAPLSALAAALLGSAPASAAAVSPNPEAAYVVLGEGGATVARAITRDGKCPTLVADGRALSMHLRAAPSVEPQRPTASPRELSKPSEFPVRVCERILPAGTRTASIAGARLPLPPRQVRRIVVIGDTGCRLKAKDVAWQACNDPDRYPFARIAAKAAAWKPDAVIHVGDYLYRENPCPQGNAGCAGSPWGYGWDAWQADFFAPAQPLLAAAPWIVVRGNHENCARAGQGWWRLLDPRPLLPGRDCNDSANDVAGDYSPAYAVPLGHGAQVVVMDLAIAGDKPIPADDPRTGEFRQTWRELARFAQHGTFTFAADHYPVFGVAAEAKHDAVKLEMGNRALQPIFAGLDPHVMPAEVDTLLAGHIHVWEHVGFAGKQPSQFVAGFSGTEEDTVPLPKVLPAAVTSAPNAPVRQFNSIVDQFGFMTLQRTGPRTWAATVYSLAGTPVEHCRINGRSSTCSN